MHRSALIEFFQADHDLLLYVVRPDVPEKGIADREPPIVRVNVERTRIQGLVQQIRDDLKVADQLPLTEFTARFQETIEAFHQLGRLVFTPEILALLDPFDGVYLVPFGDWNYLPLHAMPLDDAAETLLIDRFQVAYLPNASVLQFMAEPHAAAVSEPVAGLFVGTDYTGFSHLFRDEAAQVAALPVFDAAASVLLKPRASTVEQLMRHSKNKRVIHVSSHGYFNPLDALASGVILWNGDDGWADLEPALLAENPERFNVLSARGIAGEGQFSAELVVLSGCVTGQNERRSGDELIGLSRSLLYAGAQAMIVALFPVLKNVTAHGTSAYHASRFARFYELWLQEHHSKAAAFRHWVNGIRQIPLYAHPYCWFSFIYTGKI